MEQPIVIDRRSFLKNATFAAVSLTMATGGLSLLSACGSSESKSSSIGSLTYQLGWVKNVQWSGSYFADKMGYYKAEGFKSVNLMSGGPSAPPIESVVSSGKALVGVSSPSATAAAILQGARLKTVGAMYQNSPYCIISLPDKPIRTPADMVGKRIGVPQNNQPTWDAFLNVNKLSGSDIKVVPVGFNPSVLPDHQVDGLMAFVSNEPISLQAQGVATNVMRFSDFNYHAINNNYVVSEDTLQKDPDAVKAFLRGEIRGWKKALANSQEAAALTVNNYGSDLGLDIKTQTSQIEVQKSLMETDNTKKNGLFTLTDDLADSSIHVLNLTGVAISADQFFALDLIREVYTQDPSLR